MVVTLLYTHTGTEICKEIGTKIGRYRETERYILLAYCLEFVGRLMAGFGSVGSVGSFGLVWYFGSYFFALHKKIF